MAETKTLHSELLAAQMEMDNPKRSKTATVKGVSRAGKDYEMSYNYATLDDTLKCVTDALHKHGIGVIQRMVSTEDGRIGVNTIAYGYGEEIDLGTIASKESDNPQQNGILITYYRRYGLGAFGVSPEDDTDGGDGSNGHPANIPTSASAPRSAPQASKPSAGEDFTLPFDMGSHVKGETLRGIGASGYDNDMEWLDWFSKNFGILKDGSENPKFAERNAKTRALAASILAEFSGAHVPEIDAPLDDQPDIPF
jgi:hypothetical protein